ncbi:hypothetical protein CRUP_035204, partial [Coryphaenoides rupestris]
MVNFEKMHKVAEMVRTIRRYRSTPLANLSPKDGETLNQRPWFKPWFFR